jgi:hypothetical protein
LRASALARPRSKIFQLKERLLWALVRWFPVRVVVRRKGGVTDSFVVYPRDTIEITET